MASIVVSGIIFARRPATAALLVIVMTCWIPGKGGPEGPVK
jgi:hypothetical protein